MANGINKFDFPTTRWTVIESAGKDESDEAAELNTLLKLYLPALTAHLVAAWKLPKEKAEDYIQGFATDKVLRAQLLAKADRKRGRFRNFLLTSLENYVISCLRKEQSQKRTPKGLPASPEDFLIQPPGHSAAFDIVLIKQMIEEALRRMEAECRHTGRDAMWGIFEIRVLKPLLNNEEPPAYPDLVARFGFKSPVQASNALITAKRMFSRVFRDVFSAYEKSSGRIEDEIAEARNLLKKYGFHAAPTAKRSKK